MVMRATTGQSIVDDTPSGLPAQGQQLTGCRPLLLALLLLIGVCAVTCVQAQPTQVRLDIDMRELIATGRFDPQRDRLGVRGGHPPLSWQRSWPAQAIGDGLYRVELRFERPPFGGQPVLYKLHLGKPDGSEAEQWEPGRNHAWQLTGGELQLARRFGAEAVTRATLAPPA